MDPVTAEIETMIRTLEQVSTGKQTGSYAVKDAGDVNITADECKKLCSKIGLKYYDGFERRIVQYKFTDATTDRYGDRITAKGVQLDKYRANPIVLGFHNSYTFPIGATIKTWYEKSDDSVKGWVLFFDGNIDDTGISESTFKFVTSGAVKTGSIGFIPVAGKVRKPTEEEKTTYGMTDWGYIYDEIELLEYSIVPLPANPSSMSEPITKSFTRKDFEKSLSRMKDNEIFPEKQMKELIEMIKARNAGKGADNVEDKSGSPAVPVAPATIPEKMEPQSKGVFINLQFNTVEDMDQKQIDSLTAKGYKLNIKIGPEPVTNQIFNIDDLADKIHSKAGAVLSKKNKTLVKDTVAILSKSLEALQELLKAAGGDGDAEDNADNGSDDDEENDDGSKKPKKGKATQTGSPTGDPTAVTPNPYSSKIFDALDNGIKAIDEVVKK